MATCKLKFVYQRLETWGPSDKQKRRLETLLIPWAEVEAAGANPGAGRRRAQHENH